jgi:hypothetical protein
MREVDSAQSTIALDVNLLVYAHRRATLEHKGRADA